MVVERLSALRALQPRAYDILSGALQRGRLHHAYILAARDASAARQVGLASTLR